MTKLKVVVRNFAKVPKYLRKCQYFFSCGARALRPRQSHFLGFGITLRHATICRTPLDERPARRKDHYLREHNNDKNRYPCPRRDSNPQCQQAGGQVSKVSLEIQRVLVSVINSLSLEGQTENLFLLLHRACCWFIQLLHQPLHIYKIYKTYTLKY